METTKQLVSGRTVEEEREEPKARSRNIDATEQDGKVTYGEVINATRQLKNGKLPENDKVTFEIIKNMDSSRNTLILEIFNKA